MLQAGYSVKLFGVQWLGERPVLGWLAGLAAVLLGLGAIWQWASDWLRNRRRSRLRRVARLTQFDWEG